MFAEKGVVIVDNEDDEIDLEAFGEHVIEIDGVDDYGASDDVIEVFTASGGIASAAGAALTELGYKILSAQDEMIPSNYTELTDEEQVKKMTTMLELLEDNDDVQNVWHSWSE
jgi:transcriptional/translational regulatory protein YebC/TACO1